MKIFKNKFYDFLIFGANGDLTKRKLLPALYNLEKNNCLNNNENIICIGRINLSNKKYINNMYKSLINFVDYKIDIKIWKKLSKKLLFINVNINNIKEFIKIKKLINNYDKIIISYFAVPSNIFENICKGLSYINLNHKNVRIIVEKPIGNSLNTFKIINNKINKFFKEKQIFYIDHYLGKEMVLNLFILRFSNILFLNIWNNNFIESIHINVYEKIGIEGRWNYFDKIGQTRDMVQNHLLQLLTIIAMKPPNIFNSKNIKKEKIKILKSLRKINIYSIKKNTIKGQYINGIIENKKVPGYLEELDSNVNSKTETFVSIRAYIDNFQWMGVPFYLNTGKRLINKKSEIIIYFKKPAVNLFKKYINYLPNNKLIINLQPKESININIINKIPNLNHKLILKEINLKFDYKKIFNYKYIYDSYECLLLEVINNRKYLFVDKKEIELSWLWIDNIINFWKINNQKLYKYHSGLSL
ncbi:Glucose-6-phosphate 1-dehydrogenase [Candidatus Annandia adelgestsuga]|uniref:Glucose-6-phosphate 1-dehydrogenase n=1 Tax=Candidatus Annandia adelgestsuga TaxID=1302411 RepID=A0A3S9J7V9_9ENTR|nr:glucose-6-phosphate dehydrogenase [Candidatus Annandia adelgestsuga]AZP36394.1 Glucose-6-phosphate 1-dehydrogenase [Candidatus Annandia adelgestsuga]